MNGFPGLTDLLVKYISTVWPFYNESSSRHVWAISRDVGSCRTPWGSFAPEIGDGIVLTNWGGVTGLDGQVQPRCFEAGRDIVMPPPMHW
eukprot:6173933-Pleurochrysis_carterae.AAC.1